MPKCEHCGTEFTPRTPGEPFCCRGCEFVAVLIKENGFDQFYDLKQGLAVAPVRSRPFEEHDFSWLPPKITEAEEKAKSRGEAARLELALEGISCVGCVWLVEKLFARHPGAIRAVANPSNGRLHLEWVPHTCHLEPFLRELVQFGYVAAPAGAVTSDYERRRLAARLGLCGAFALNTMGFTLPMYLNMPPDFEFAALFRLIAFLSATLSMLVGAGYFIDRAWRSLRAGSLHIDLPIALGLIAAYAGSITGWALMEERLMYFDFVSIFVFLMLCGRYLQTSAVERNRRRLVRQQPVPETVPPASPDDSPTPIPRDQIRPGTRFALAPGQALPVASTMSSGDAEFSLEWIHGEPDAVRFSPGARLPAGAILLSRAPVTVQADESWADSLLAKLTAPGTVERGSPGLERLLRGYLTTVIALGIATFALWLLRGEWITGLQAMISVFVVSCPCALGVAIPLADDLAASAVERLGVYVRTATLWPRLRRIRKVVFDKTGTLTLERPTLDNPEAVQQLNDPAALALAQLTRNSLHPVARALLEALGTRGQKLLASHPNPETPEEFPGTGTVLQTPLGRWSLGKPGWDGSSPTTHATTPGAELRLNGHPIASFVFSESLRPGAKETVAHLAARNLSLHILSGDHPQRVAHMAHALDLPPERAHGGLSPEEKAHQVKSLSDHDLLYLGDGANDSLAFDDALVTGTPVVDRSLLEAKADFFTLGAGLTFLPSLLRTAETRALAVRTAFAFAVLYNLTTVAFSMAGHMSPLVASIIMPLSSVASISIVAGISRAIDANKG